MKWSYCAGSFLLGAVIAGGCAAPIQTAPVRVRVATAAFEQHSHAQLAERVGQRSHKESPAISACKSGNTKSCIEVGDRLVVKHAPVEALQWYKIACDRVANSMLPTATRLMQLHQDLKQLSSAKSDEQSAASQRRVAELKSEASEIKARVQGCFDAGDILKADDELKQALKDFDTACEFSTLVPAIGESVPGLEYVADNACAAGQSVRAQMSGASAFDPQLFEAVLAPKAKPASKQTVKESEEGMVFSESDL